MAIFALFLLAACSVKEPLASQEEPQDPQTEELTPAFVPGVVSVKFSEDLTRRIEDALENHVSVATKAPQLDEVFQELGVKSLRRVFPYAGEFEPRTRREGLHRFYYVEFNEEQPVTKAAAQLGTMPGVEHVTPQLPVRLRTFNDPYFSSQWHFVNQRYTGADINVQKVWDQFTVGKSSVIVSVVDEGVNMSHEDLQGNLVPCYADGTGSYNFNNDTPTVVPTQGHGSHVAGIISAVSNNGIGVAGIAGGDAAAGKPGVKVMSCQIFDLYGAEPDLFAAMKHGADHGASIMQCSWGFSPDLNGDGFITVEEETTYRAYTISDLPEYKAAIDYFIKYAGCDNDGNQLADSPMKGGLVIFASGNDNYDYDPLVSYDAVIAVGSFGPTGRKSSFSNYGDWLDIAAPGGEEKSVGIYSTLLGNSYGGSDWIGTSMACPHVSGVAALLISYFGGPGFTAEECRTRLIRGAVPNAFPGSTRYIGRKLDAYGAFTFDLNTPIVPPVLSWADASVQQSGLVELRYNEEKELEITATDPGNQYVNLKLSTPHKGVSITDEGKLLLKASEMGLGTAAISVTGTNEDQASVSLKVNVKVRTNEAPAPTDAFCEGISLEGAGESQTISLTSWFQDPDADPLSFTAEAAHPEVAQITLSEGGDLAIKAVDSGITPVTVTVTDGNSQYAAQIMVVVKNPMASVFVYPASASQYVNIAIDATSMVDVQAIFYSSAGVRVKEAKVQGDVFHPLSMNVKNLAPGYYTVKLSYSGNTHMVGFNKI